MILKYKIPDGRIRNTEKPYFIEWYYDIYRNPAMVAWSEKHRNRPLEPRDYSYRESNWTYYRSYRTIDACVQAWTDMTNHAKKSKCRINWYRIGKTDFGTWPLNYEWTGLKGGDGRKYKTYTESLIIEE